MCFLANTTSFSVDLYKKYQFEADFYQKHDLYLDAFAMDGTILSRTCPDNHDPDSLAIPNYKTLLDFAIHFLSEAFRPSEESGKSSD